MSSHRVALLAAIAALGIAWVSADAFAARVGARGGAVAARSGAIAQRGALAYRGGLYGGRYYRPGFGLAAGAVVGGAIAASRPWNGYDYDSGVYGYDSGYYAPSNGYGYGTYGYAPAANNDAVGYSGACTSSSANDIACGGRCWMNISNGNYAWVDCRK